MASELRSDQLAPHSIEAEEAVLGSILISPDAYYEVAPIIRPGDFFIVRHGWVFEVIASLAAEQAPIDYLTVVERLEERGKLKEIGGASYILALINKTPSALNVEGYAQIVARMSVRRQLIDAAQKVARVAHSDETDIDEVVRQAHEHVLTVGARAAQTNRVRVCDVHEVNDDTPRGTLVTECPELDEVTDYSIAHGTLMTLLAASGQFKSTLAGQWSADWALQDHTCLYVSMEDWPEEIKGQMVRYLAFTRRWTVQDAKRHLDKSPLEFVSKRQYVSDIRSHMMAMSAGGQRGIVVIDTLQKLRDCEGRYGVDTGAVARTMAELDGLKLDTGWLIIVLVQQYLETNTHDPNKLRPSRNNVKDSKAVYEASDIMLGGYYADAWRLEYPGVFEDSACGPGEYLIKALKLRRGNRMRKSSGKLVVVDNIPAVVSPSLLQKPVQQTFAAASVPAGVGR